MASASVGFFLHLGEDFRSLLKLILNQSGKDSHQHKTMTYHGEIHKAQNTKFKVNIVPLKIAFLCIPSHARTGS